MYKENYDGHKIMLWQRPSIETGTEHQKKMNEEPKGITNEYKVDA